MVEKERACVSAPRVSLRIETTCKSGGTRSCSVLMSYCACILFVY